MSVLLIALFSAPSMGPDRSCSVNVGRNRLSGEGQGWRGTGLRRDVGLKRRNPSDLAVNWMRGCVNA